MGSQPYRGPINLGAGQYSSGFDIYGIRAPDQTVFANGDYDLKQNKPFEFLTKVATEKKSNLSDITALNLMQKDPLLTVNETGRVQLTSEAFTQAGAAGFDAGFINEGLKEQYLAFYSPEMKANVLGTIVDSDFTNTRLLKRGITNIDFGGRGGNIEHGFITDDESRDGLYSFSNFGFKDPTFNTSEQIETNQESLGSGVRFERSSVNIFSGAVRDRDFKTGETLSKNILSGATTNIGSDRANDLLGVNKDK